MGILSLMPNSFTFYDTVRPVPEGDRRLNRLNMSQVSDCLSCLPI